MARGPDRMSKAGSGKAPKETTMEARKQADFKAYDGRTVLVTGGAGAIGSNLSRALVEAGARVIVLDDLSSAERWNIPSLRGLMFVEGDVRDEVKLKRVFFERPSIVFHLAAF